MIGMHAPEHSYYPVLHCARHVAATQGDKRGVFAS